MSKKEEDQDKDKEKKGSENNKSLNDCLQKLSYGFVIYSPTKEQLLKQLLKQLEHLNFSLVTSEMLSEALRNLSLKTSKGDDGNSSLSDETQELTEEDLVATLSMLDYSNTRAYA